MPVDVSMYPTAQAKPIDPLNMIQGYASAANAMSQNKLLQYQIGAQQELGKILSEAVDPETGDVDYDKAFKLSKSSSYGGINVEKLAALRNSQEEPQQVFNPKTGNYELRQRQYLQHAARSQANAAKGQNALMDIPQANQPQSQTQPIVNQLTGDTAPNNAEIGQSVINSGEYDMSPSPGQGEGPPMAQDVADRVHTHNTKLMTALAPLAQNPNVSMRDVMKTVADIGADPDIKFSHTDGAVLLSKLPEGLTPQQINQAATGMLRNLQQDDEMMTQHYPSSNQLKAKQQATALANEQEQPPAAPVNLTMDQNTQHETPNTENISFNPAPGVEIAATGAAENYNDLNKAVTGSGARIFTLQKALHALEGANTGPGSSIPNEVKSFIIAHKPEFWQKIGLPTPDPNTVANYDEATKYLTQIAMNMPNAGNSVPALNSALTGNASTNISNMAATDVVKTQIALEKMQQAQTQAFNESGMSPSQFNKWQIDWNAKQDPRAYIMSELTPQQQQKVKDSIDTSEEKVKFVNSLKMAMKYGHFSPKKATSQ